jgi:hypothetical protein
MITVIVTFQMPQPVAQDEARKIFESTAPRYQEVAGLIRKYYVVSEDGKKAGGVYLWKSKADADAMYTDTWKAFVREKYGTDPSITYMITPVVVDNLTREILSA